MNFLAFVAAVMILTADSNDSGRHGNTQVSAAIEYRTVDRSGNEMILSVRSGDPYYGRYYGRDDFYYDDCHYYRYYPKKYKGPKQRVYVVHEPVYVVHDRYYDGYWRAVREREVRYAKNYPKSHKDDGRIWVRSSGNGPSVSFDSKSSGTSSGKSNGKGNGKSKSKGKSKDH